MTFIIIGYLGKTCLFNKNRDKYGYFKNKYWNFIISKLINKRVTVLNLLSYRIYSMSFSVIPHDKLVITFEFQGNKIIPILKNKCNLSFNTYEAFKKIDTKIR